MKKRMIEEKAKFQPVLKAIVSVPAGYKKPISEFQARREAGARSTNSKVYWDAVASTPVGMSWKEYEVVHCKEHDRDELVPSGNYYDGMLSLWYTAGLHPRYSIWGVLRAKYSRLPRWAVYATTGLSNMLIEYKDDPDGFADAVVRDYKTRQNVPIVVAGRTWRVPRDFRDKLKAHQLTMDDYNKATNQTLRRLMIASRAVSIEEVIKGMNVLVQDDEGEILMTPRGQHYLHVVCPTTGQHYLLGIPPRPVCAHGVSIIQDGANFAIHHEGEPTNRWGERLWGGCPPIPMMTGWTPASARRWTFGLSDDAQFIQEA